MATMPLTGANDFPVICVGGSAGGLDAYIRLLSHLPCRFGRRGRHRQSLAKDGDASARNPSALHQDARGVDHGKVWSSAQTTSSSFHPSAICMFFGGSFV